MSDLQPTTYIVVTEYQSGSFGVPELVEADNPHEAAEAYRFSSPGRRVLVIPRDQATSWLIHTTAEQFEENEPERTPR